MKRADEFFQSLPPLPESESDLLDGEGSSALEIEEMTSVSSEMEEGQVCHQPVSSVAPF